MPKRRGVAMLLVLVALGVGTILAGAMLTSKEQTPRIGLNARQSAAAAWSANSAASIGEAMLQSFADWHAEVSQDGKLIDNMPIAGGFVTVTLTNPQGQIPTVDDRELIMTSIATVGGISTTVQRWISTAPPAPIESAVNLELPEFAIFAGKSLTIENSAKIGRFASSPESVTLMPVKVGTGFAASSSLDVQNGVRLADVSLFVDANATASLITRVTDGSFRPGSRIPVAVPTIAAILPPEINALPTTRLTDLTVSGGGFPMSATQTLAAGGKYQNITATNGGTLIVDAARGTQYQFNNLSIRAGSSMRIKGRVQIHVKGNLTVENLSTIDFLDSTGEVTFYLGGNALISNATVGLSKAIAGDVNRTGEAVSNYVYPIRVKLLALSPASGGLADPFYDIAQKGIFVGSIHNPAGDVEIRNNCALIGRATAGDLAIRSGARLLYDPRLDPRIGFTVINGPLYDGPMPRPEFVTALAAMDTSNTMGRLTADLATAVKAAIEPVLEWGKMSSMDADDSSKTSGGLVEGTVEKTVDLLDDVGDILGGLLGGGGGGGGGEIEVATIEGVSARAAARAVSRPIPLAAHQMED